MTVAFDAATESIRTATTDPYSFNHTGRATGSGGVQGVVVVTMNYTTATDQIAGVTYGGVAMEKVVRAVDTSTEPTDCTIWFLGSGVGDGTQSVQVDFTSATTDDYYIVAVTLTGSGDMAVVHADTRGNNQANPATVLNTLGYECLTIGGIASGLPNVTDLTLLSGMTAVHNNDAGAEVQRVDRQTTASTSAFTFGYTSATDDVAMAAAAITDDSTFVWDEGFEASTDGTTMTTDTTTYSGVGSGGTLTHEDNTDPGWIPAGSLMASLVTTSGTRIMTRDRVVSGESTFTVFRGYVCPVANVLNIDYDFFRVQDSVAGSPRVRLSFQNDRQIELRDANTLRHTSTKAFSLGEWLRFEVLIDEGSNDVYAHYWWGADIHSTSTGATNYEGSGAQTWTQNAYDQIRMGHITSYEGTTYFDAIAWRKASSTTDYLGPPADANAWPSGPIVEAIGTATETDSATGVGRVKTLALGTATETDTAVGVTVVSGGPQIVAVGTAAETDTATGVGRRKTRALGAATETDTPTGLAKAKRKAVGTATETDAATGLGRAKRKAVTAATEADAGVALTRRKTKTLGAAAETDAAVGVAVVFGADIVPVGTATETDTATGLGRRKTRTLGVATETDLAVGIGDRRSVGTATETDTATGVARRKSRTLGVAAETDAPTGVARRKRRSVGTATATQTAVAVSRRKTRTLGVGTETDTAVGLGESKSLGTAAETDAATGVTRRKVKALGVATETDAAVGVGGGQGVTFLFQEDFEGTPGAAMSSGNTAWDLFNGAGTRTLESTPTPRYGSTLGEYNGGQALTKDTTSLPGTTNGGSVRRVLYFRGYYKLDSTSSLTLSRLIVFEESVANGGADVAVVRMNANGTLRLMDGTTAVGTASTKALDTDWTRIEFKIDQDANTMEVRCWWGADLQSTSTGATNYESQSATLSTNTDMEVFGTGFYASQATNHSLYVEEVAVGYGGWIGPAPAAIVGTLTAATESDAAVGVTRRKTKALGTATETDAATGLTRRKRRTLGVGLETDTAVGIQRAGVLGLAVETDTAGALGRKKVKALGVAIEVDTAVGIGSPTIVVLGTAFETDTAIGITSSQAVALYLFTPPVRGGPGRLNTERHPQPSARARFRLYAKRAPTPVSVEIVDGVAVERRLPTDGPNVFQGGRTYEIRGDDPRLAALEEKYGPPVLVRV